MEKRVYREGGGKGLTRLLLFFSAILLLSGLLWRPEDPDLLLNAAPTATPIPTDEVFDETPESREWTLPGHTWYALQLGTFEEETAAKELAAQFRPRGAAGYVWADTRYRALAALYDSREDAQAVRYKLWDSHGIDAYPYEIALPALKLRMQGMKGQLDILEAAFSGAKEWVAVLQDLSIALDRQELTVPEALAALHQQGQRLDTMTLRLTQRFTQPRHATVEGLLTLYQTQREQMAALNESLNAVEFATAVKYQTLDGLYRLKAVYDQISHT